MDSDSDGLEDAPSFIPASPVKPKKPKRVDLTAKLNLLLEEQIKENEEDILLDKAKRELLENIKERTDSQESSQEALTGESLAEEHACHIEKVCF